MLSGFSAFNYLFLLADFPNAFARGISERGTEGIDVNAAAAGKARIDLKRLGIEGRVKIVINLLDALFMEPLVAAVGDKVLQ